MPRLIFDQSARDFVLDAFGKASDRHGYIVEKAHRDKRVLTKNGMEIRKKNFAGILKGSEIYYKSDITSLIDLYDNLERKRQKK